MERIKGYVFLAVFILCACFAVVLIEVQSDYGRKLKEKDEIIKKKQELIDSQVRMIIELKDNCERNCDDSWLWSFYDEFHDEVGAYE